MTEIKVIFEGIGRRTEKAFPTIAETVKYLVKNGYTRISGDGTASVQNLRVYTRLYKDTRSGRYARINTTTDPNAWIPIIGQVAGDEGALWAASL